MNRNNVVLIGTVGALAVGLGGWAMTRQKGGDGVVYRTADVKRQDLRQTVSATGTVQPFKVVDIKSRAGGEVRVLSVEVGDSVKQGQLIARIDPSDSQTTYTQAQADVEAARARVSQSEQTRSLQAATTMTSLAQARAQVRVAEAQVRAAEARLTQARKQSAAQPALTQAAIAQSKASLQSAEQQLAQLKSASDPQARADAKASLAQAQANLKNAEQNLKRQQQLAAKGFVAQSAVDTAQAQYDVLVAQAETAGTRAETVGNSQTAAIAAAEARVSEAKQSLVAAEANRVQIDLRRQDVANAEAALLQSRANVEQARAGLAAAEANKAQIGIRAADIETAKSQVTRAQASLSNADVVLNSTTIRAPRSGVVLQKYIEQGTIISSGQSFNSQGTSLIQLGDLSRVLVDALIDETDIAQVRVGQKVKLNFDAFADGEFEGIVRRIDPRGTTDQNITTIKTQIEVLKPDPRLRPGLNAECEFLISEKKDVIVIPSRSVRNEKGQKVVLVLPKTEKGAAPGKPETRPVTIGMETGDAVEVVSGLKEGEQVVTATIDPSSGGGGGGGKGSSGGGPGGSRGPGGLGGGGRGF
jgi:HlyD family secretion protein